MKKMHVPALLTLMLALVQPVRAQLVTYDFEGETTAPTSKDAGVSAGEFARNPGNSVTFPAGSGSVDSISGSGWVGADASNDEYWEFTVTANAGLRLNPTSLEFDYRSTASGPTNWEVFVNQVNVAGGSFQTDATFRPLQVSLAFGDLTEATVRISGFGASSSGGTLSVDNVALNGVVTPVPEPATWFLLASGLCGIAFRRRKPR